MTSQIFVKVKIKATQNYQGFKRFLLVFYHFGSSDYITMIQSQFLYRVYYEDTDLGGVVYYANYLKFFERARTDYLRQLGINQSQLAKDENLIFVVRSCLINYYSPARLDDILEVKVEIKALNPASIFLNQKIEIQQKLITSLEVELVCVDSVSFRPKKIPNNLKNRLHV